MSWGSINAYHYHLSSAGTTFLLEINPGDTVVVFEFFVTAERLRFADA